MLEMTTNSANGDDATRRSILDAALRILTEQGHQALTVRRVASLAGCSTIGVYTWFGGKDGLVDALWVEAFSSFGGAIKKARPLPGPIGRLRAQAHAYRKWALAHPAHYQVMFFNVIPGHAPGVEATIAAISAYETLFSAVKNASELGELRSEDVEAIALTCWATIHGLVSLQIAGAKPEPAPNRTSLDKRAFDIAIDALVNGLVITSK
jgi:AcrR family transcriptional regulator